MEVWRWVISGRSHRWRGREGQGHEAGAVSGRDGCGDPVDAAGRADRTALSESRQGRQPLGLEKMLRIYFLQQWFNLSDPQAEDSIYDSESMRRFVGVELGEEVVPDETTILRFRHLLEKHGLTKAIFDAINGLLEERRLLLRSGTIVDATIIAAPSSTKNAERTATPR